MRSLAGQVGQALRAAITARGVTQAVVARRCGMPRTGVTHYLTGRRNMTLANLERLAEGLDYTVLVELVPRDD